MSYVLLAVYVISAAVCAALIIADVRRRAVLELGELIGYTVLTLVPVLNSLVIVCLVATWAHDLSDVVVWKRKDAK